MTMTIDLDRLRELAKEPEREAMPRTSQFPSMTDQLLRQRQEIDALRRGLSDAIQEINSLRSALSVAEPYVDREYGTGNWQEQLERDQSLIRRALGKS